MSLETRLEALVSAIGADIKQLQEQVTVLVNAAVFDAGGPSTTPYNIFDAGGSTTTPDNSYDAGSP